MITLLESLPLITNQMGGADLHLIGRYPRPHQSIKRDKRATKLWSLE
ncbi:MAG: hypothetical protein ABTR07_03680 [Candidatus Competibacter denitrificans]